MNVIIIEDEAPAVDRLKKMLLSLDSSLSILAELDSISSTVHWLSNNPHPDLIFSDINLTDGLCFSIFDQVKVSCPIIFTTAFDQYAIKAFEVNSIDYLLKPISAPGLEKAWKKFQSLEKQQLPLLDLLQAFEAKKSGLEYKTRFLVKVGDNFKYLSVSDSRYFMSLDSTTYFVGSDGERYIIDESLDQLEESLDPKSFFRVNRKFLLKENSIDSIKSYFNSRLKLSVKPQAEHDIVVARERVAAFKLWLNH